MMHFGKSTINTVGNLKAAALLALVGLCLIAVDSQAVDRQAANNCRKQARTPLEKLYCDIKAKGEGATLPGLEDFRRNTSQIQRLLLKRPAGKLGLAMPEATREKPVASEPENQAQAITASSSAAATRPKVENPPQAVPLPSQLASNKQPPKQSCQLNGPTIHCGQSTFALVNNLANNRLSAEALDDSNHLVLPDWQPEAGLSEHAYLTDAYRVYIDKMMDIGLGAATMSFTRFYHNYQDAKVQDTDFRQRFSEMYEYLKADKKSMQTPKRLVSALPEGIEQCDFLRRDLMVCDNGFHNWLYQAH